MTERISVSVTSAKSIALLEAYNEVYGFSYAKTIDLALKGLLPQLKPKKVH